MLQAVVKQAIEYSGDIRESLAVEIANKVGMLFQSSADV